MSIRSLVLVLILIPLVACGGTRNAAKALGAAREASKAACERSRSARAEATSSVQDADAALVASQKALEAASKNGQRPKAATKAALYDQADEAVRASTERLRLAKDQMEAASRSEESACQGM